MRDKNNRNFGVLPRFVAWSAIFGVIASLFFAPALIAGGKVASTALEIFQSLPANIKPVNGSDASTIYALQDGQPVEIATFFEENRKSIPFESMSENVVNATVATEDPRFYEHGGVDWISFIRATLGNAVSGGGGPGGSTITMQYVKNTLVEIATQSGDKEAAAAATVSSGIPGIYRKIKEIRLALQLEQEVSKKDILAGYLNLSFFGGRVYGVEQAAEYYYGVTAKNLDIAQAAMLAAMLKSPNDYRPDKAENLDRAKSRRDYVLKNMLDAKYITQSEYEKAKQENVAATATTEPAGCEADQTTAFFCDFVVWTIRNSPEFGYTPEERENLLRRGGLEIYTTLDLNVQRNADSVIKKAVPSADKSRVGSASVTVEVGTGRIISMAVNRVFDQTEGAKDLPGHTSVNYATDKTYGGSSGFQVGSTYKVFTLAQWLIAGRKLGDHVDAREREYLPSDFSAKCGGLVDNWAPKNDQKKEPEDVSVQRATAISENTAFAAMATKLDLCDIRDTAMRFGIHRADGAPLGYSQSSILGVNEIAPLSVAAAFAGIANGGKYCSPIAIDRLVKRSSGEEIAVPQTVCNEAVSPEVASAMIVAMRSVIRGGTGGASSTGDGADLAGKTGTTDSGIHTWMSGFSSKLATSVWVGNVVGLKSMRSTYINGKQASTLRHTIWRGVMKFANRSYKPGPLPVIKTDLTGVTMVQVPDVIGLSPADATAKLEQAGFGVKLSAKTIVSPVAAGMVGFASGSGGTLASGTLIEIRLSIGGKIIVPDVRGMTVEQARQAITDAGFAGADIPNPATQGQFYVNDPDIPKGNVVRTIPSAGTEADASGLILLVISG
ncbi:MAG: transglycosylase domain-containing protein [Micrococcales bacterium]